MKKISYLLVVLSLLLGTSCTNDFEQEMNDGKFSFSSISASMGDLPTTKTHLENGGRMVWDIDDQIGIISDVQTEATRFTCTSIDDSKAFFTSNGEVSGNNFIAYYPYNKINVSENILTYSLRDCVWDENTISQAPMIAESTTNEFNFKHTCGFLRFSITGTQTIKQLTLKGNNNEKLSGKGTIDIEAEVPILSMSSDAYSWINYSLVPDIKLSSEKAKDFYFVVPVGKFTKGLTLEITCVNDDSSTTVIKKSTNKSIEVSRSVIKSFSVFDTDDLIEEIANEEENIYGALMAFYNATDGANWHNNTNWGDKNVPYGEWYGLSVSYAGDENYGKIKGISMNENNLKGSFPNEIIHLKDLEYLYLADNEIDNIPASLCELPLLEEIYMGNCGLSGELPEKISQLKNLKMLNLPFNKLSGNIDFLGQLSSSVEFIDLQSNELSGTIPTDLGNLINLYHLYLRSNNLTGTIPETLSELPSLKNLHLGENNLSGEIPTFFNKFKVLEELSILYNKFTGNIPEELGEITTLKVLNLGYNNLSGEIPKEIANLKKLEKLYLGSNQLTGRIPKEIANIKNIKILNLSLNQLTGIIPENFVNLLKLEYLYLDGNKLDGECSAIISDYISSLKYYTIEQQNGYELKFNFYESTDFSEDGVVQTLQIHKKGNGIKFIITMDGFSDRQIKNGIVNTYVQKAYEALFSEEPYTTFKDYFDVYVVQSVSPRERIGEKCALGTSIYDEHYSLDYNEVESHVGRTLTLTDNTHILVLLNDKSLARANCAWLSYGSIACSGIDSENDDMAKTIRHEVLGHGIGKLEDEYIETPGLGVESENPYAGSFPQTSWQSIWNGHANGWGLNVDVTNDPSKIVWKDFLNNDDYKVENIGIYEGALLYAKGAYRATKQSIMRENFGGFNAPSRWAIYKHILEAAGETPTFEAFLEYDKKNLTSTRSILLDNTSDEPIDKRKLGAPPIFLNR